MSRLTFKDKYGNIGSYNPQETLQRLFELEEILSDRSTKINSYGDIESVVMLLSESEEDDWHKECVDKLAECEYIVNR